MLAALRSPRAFLLLLVTCGGAIGLAHCGDDEESSVDPGANDAAVGNDGSVTGDGSTGDNDGGSTDGDGPKVPRCDPNKPFGPPMMLLENSFRIDQAARLSPDELTLYYASYGHDGVNGQTDLYVAMRASINVPFKNPTKIVELSDPVDGEGYPTVTADGLTIYYQGKLGDAGYGVLKSTRPDTKSAWGPPEMLTGLDLSMIYVSPDNTRLYGVKDMPGGPPYRADIHYVDLPYTGGPSKTLLGGGGLKYWPVLSPDGLTMFWSYPMLLPYRWELGVSKRTSTNDFFDAATKVKELDEDGGADEDPTWISPDGCTLYFRRVNGNITNNASGLLQTTRGL